MRRSIALAVLAILGSAMVSSGCRDMATVSGTAIIREKMALPPDVAVEVVLEDISRADVASVVLAEVVLENAGQPPYAFELAYDPGAVDERGRYSLRARVTHEGRLLFVTDQVYPVLTGGHGDSADLLLVHVAAQKEGALRGMFMYMADAAVFTDCRTGRRLPVAMEAGYPDLERAYLESRPEPGAAVLVEITGRIAEREGMEGGVRDAVIVERFEGVWPGETCGNAGMTEKLEGTYWKLTRLGGEPVTVFPDQREPHLVLRDDEQQAVGSAGCNQFHGGYTLDGDALTFGPAAATMMYCAEGMDQEQAILAALGRIAGWRIEGQHLDLLDEDGTVVLRGEARAMP